MNTQVAYFSVLLEEDSKARYPTLLLNPRVLYVCQ